MMIRRNAAAMKGTEINEWMKRGEGCDEDSSSRAIRSIHVQLLLWPLGGDRQKQTATPLYSFRILFYYTNLPSQLLLGLLIT